MNISKIQLDLDNIFGGDSPFEGPVDPPADSGTESFIVLFRNGLVIFAAVLAIAAVIFIGIAVLRVISSAGSQEEIEGGFESLKNIIVGLLFTFAVVIVIIIIVNIFIEGSLI